jgi:hypothetical protein
MKTIDIKAIRKAAGIKASDLAEALFPNHKSPYMALCYIQQGRASLDTEQLQTFANLVGLPVGLLLDNADWHMSIVQGELKIIKFQAYEYTAYYNYSDNTTTVSSNRGVLYDKVKHDGDSMELGEYLDFLTELLIKYKSSKLLLSK